MEYFWLIIAIATAIYAAYEWNKDPKILDENIFLFIFPFVAAGLFGMRRFIRRRQAEREKKEE